MKSWLTLILTELLFSHLSAQDSWNQKNDFPTSRGYAVSFCIGDYAYLGTGTSEDGNGTDFWRYDPNLDKWEKFSTMPGEGVKGAFCLVINSNAYIGGGMTLENTPNFNFWEFNPIENQWIKKKQIPFSLSRDDVAVFTIGEKGYLAQYDPGNFNFHQYNPGLDEWITLAKYPGKCIFGRIGFALNGKGYVGTGSSGNMPSGNEFYEYDPTLNQWNQKQELPGLARAFSVSFTIDNSAFVGSGWTAVGGNPLYDFLEYSSVSDTWTKVRDCPMTSIYGSAFSLGGKGYYGLGLYSNGKEIWEYTPKLSMVETFDPDKEFTVYPNPFTNQINISNPEQGLKTIEILDTMGRVVYRGEEVSGATTISGPILEGLEPGTYVLRIGNQWKVVVKTNYPIWN